jgi:hypothetical protein
VVARANSACVPLKSLTAAARLVKSYLTRDNKLFNIFIKLFFSIELKFIYENKKYLHVKSLNEELHFEVRFRRWTLSLSLSSSTSSFSSSPLLSSPSLSSLLSFSSSPSSLSSLTVKWDRLNNSMNTTQKNMP